MALTDPLPRHPERLDQLVDLYIDAAIQLEDETLLPTPHRKEVIATYLRLATVIANEVSGITGKYQREAVPC